MKHSSLKCWLCLYNFGAPLKIYGLNVSLLSVQLTGEKILKYLESCLSSTRFLVFDDGVCD